MKRKMRPKVLTLVLTTAAVMAASLPAMALAPTREVIEFSDQDFFEDCGTSIALQEVGEEVVTFRIRGTDELAYLQLHVTGSQTLTNLATNRSMTIDFRIYEQDHTVVDNGDGTLTITVLGTANTVLRDGGGRVVRRVAGSAQYQVLIDHNGTPGDPSDDEFIADLGFIRGHSGLNQFVGADFCEDFLELTG